MIGRWLRTVGALRTVQVVARPGAALVRPLAMTALRRSATRAAPSPRTVWRTPEPHLREHVIREAKRARERSGRIEFDEALASYEHAYVRDLPAHLLSRPLDAYDLAIGDEAWLAPFPAAVRARTLAIAVRLGSTGVAAFLAEAARAVLLQLELPLMGNHLLEDAIGLVAASVALEGAEARLWGAVGKAVLRRQLDAQFLSDGGHFERSATYHGWLVTALLELIELYRAAGIPVPEHLAIAVRRALSWIERVQGPDGSWPLFNDAALDACLLPAEILAFAEGVGVASTRREAHSRIDNLAATGWIVARAPNAVLVADVGPVGAAYQPGHAHADSLTFELWVAGKRAIVDFGVAQYGAGPARVDTRSTRMHNTVVVDHADSSEVWSAFRVGRRAQARLLTCAPSARASMWSAEHRGYAYLPGSPVHRRTWTLSEQALEVEDLVVGSGTHHMSTRLLVDALALENLGLRVESSATKSVPHAPATWYPRHGDPRLAVAFAVAARARLPWRHVWRVALRQ